jgi:hypothetical protein
MIRLVSRFNAPRWSGRSRLLFFFRLMIQLYRISIERWVKTSLVNSNQHQVSCLRISLTHTKVLTKPNEAKSLLNLPLEHSQEPLLISTSWSIPSEMPTKSVTSSPVNLQF